MDIGEDASFFRRIDQNIGYFYFLLGDLQYEPRIARWLKAYNTAWGEWLSSSESWNDKYYQLALSDPLFELASGRYESPDNWHSWNDFFARKLRKPYTLHHTPYTFISPCDGVIAEEGLIKTATIANWLDLLGDSPYRDAFAGGETTHIVLDVLITTASICLVMVRYWSARRSRVSTPEEASLYGMNSKAAIAMINSVLPIFKCSRRAVSLLLIHPCMAKLPSFPSASSKSVPSNGRYPTPYTLHRTPSTKVKSLVVFSSVAATSSSFSNPAALRRSPQNPSK